MCPFTTAHGPALATQTEHLIKRFVINQNKAYMCSVLAQVYTLQIAGQFKFKYASFLLFKHCCNLFLSKTPPSPVQSTRVVEVYNSYPAELRGTNS